MLICGFLFFAVVGAMDLDKRFDLYADPTRPVPSTGHVYPVLTAFGKLVYATKEEHDSWFFWERQMGDWIGVPPLLAVFLWLLYRPKRKWPPAPGFPP